MDQFHKGTSPYIHETDSVCSMMLDVCTALLPSYLWGIYVFGFRALVIGVLSVACAVLFAWLFQKLLKRPITVSDGSAALSGLLLAMCLPVAVPLWIVPIGALFAVAVKELCSFFDRFYINPALTGKALLVLLFSSYATRVTQPFEKISAFAVNPDLSGLSGGASSPLSLFDGFRWGLFDFVSPSELLTGSYAGTVGEVSTLLLLAGFLYLLVRRVVTWHVPVCFLGTVAVLSFLFPVAGTGAEYALFSLCTGGVMLTAIFMATDYFTSPVTGAGKVVYGVLCGVLTVLFRRFFSFGEGARLAVLLAGLTSVGLDRFFVPRSYGSDKAWWKFGDHAKALKARLQNLQKKA